MFSLKTEHLFIYFFYLKTNLWALDNFFPFLGHNHAESDDDHHHTDPIDERMEIRLQDGTIEKTAKSMYDKLLKRKVILQHMMMMMLCFFYTVFEIGETLIIACHNNTFSNQSYIVHVQSDPEY